MLYLQFSLGYEYVFWENKYLFSLDTNNPWVCSRLYAYSSPITSSDFFLFYGFSKPLSYPSFLWKIWQCQRKTRTIKTQGYRHQSKNIHLSPLLSSSGYDKKSWKRISLKSLKNTSIRKQNCYKHSERQTDEQIATLINSYNILHRSFAVDNKGCHMIQFFKFDFYVLLSTLAYRTNSYLSSTDVYSGQNKTTYLFLTASLKIFIICSCINMK